MAAVFAMSTVSAQSFDPAPAAEVTDIDYGGPFLDGQRYNGAIPTPRSLLGYPVGQQAATHEEIERCLIAWDQATEMTRLVEYARSYEDRPLYYMVISSQANMERLDEIKANLQKIADPRSAGSGEADRLVRNTPPVAWMAYSIHGDEMSGADAALAAIYHLIASDDDAVRRMRDELVIIVDPNMNPDGRDRFIRSIREAEGNVPNVDDQSLIHAGRWPWGRTNHYLFDLNRDWILGVHPETRGRIAAVNEWKPLLFVDCHEMGAQDTYLFSPSREPVNPNLPQARKQWWDVFAKDQAAAFDRFGWPYYTGEWNEEWYPGYSSSWAGFRGAVGILYEQAGVNHVGVRRPEGTVLTYRQSVHHQFVSTMANLVTFLEHHDELMRGFVEERRDAVSADAPFAERVFAIPPRGNRSRLERFVELMQLQGFDVLRAEREFTAAGVDQLGREHDEITLPAGTALIPNRQPEAHLVAAMLEFDPQMSSEFLTDERREILRTGSSKLYDTTAWNTTMMHGLEAYALSGGMPGNAEEWETESRQIGALPGETSIGWVIMGDDDNANAVAGHLMVRGVEVRAARKESTFGDVSFPRGSMLVTLNDNRLYGGDVRAAVEEVCRSFGVAATPLSTGLGEGNEVADIGGEYFVLLERPRIAVVGGMPISPYGYGEVWHHIDHRLGLPAAYIDSDSLSRADLRRYNVIVLPDRWGGGLPAGQIEALRTWVRSGGTLIAIGGSAEALANEESELSSVRSLGDVLGDLSEYEIAVLREWEARTISIESDDIWAHAPADELDYPWARAESDGLSEEERKRRDDWQRLFTPQGAMIAARVDDRHWLTFGVNEPLPVLYAGDTALMASDGAVVRLGVYSPVEDAADDAAEGDGEESEGEEAIRIGWAPTPQGHEMRLRMSGLLWPEAAHRIANAAVVTRERRGDGQVILFAVDPVFRGATLGTARLLTNAIVCGPGMGASHPIEP
ncbi:MAG: M14 family metallopeptidase [Planctomycetota bacterium]|nr:M14 family metallopeptidase [Planctomycetota bacterium]